MAYTSQNRLENPENPLKKAVKLKKTLAFTVSMDIIQTVLGLIYNSFINYS